MSQLKAIIVASADTHSFHQVQPRKLIVTNSILAVYNSISGLDGHYLPEHNFEPNELIHLFT